MRRPHPPPNQQITPEMKESIVSYIRRRLAPKPIKIRADVEVTCFAYEGIEAIKAALQAGLDTTTNSEVEIKLIAPPMCVRAGLPVPAGLPACVRACLWGGGP